MLIAAKQRKPVSAFNFAGLLISTLGILAVNSEKLVAERLPPTY